jgi:hypothetical protein
MVAREPMFSLLVTLACLASIAFGGCIVSNPQCYVDDNNRILGHNDQNGMDGNNNEWCAQICYNQGKKLAGTEYGIQCYCGDAGE